MATCVEISIDDQGQISVGTCAQPDSDNLQPVGSLKEALMQAAELLQGQDNGDQESAESNQEAFEQGYKGVNGGASVSQ